MAGGAAAAQAAGAVKVENALAQCVAVQPGMRTVTDGQLLLQADLEVKQSIGRCGCKSAIATYTSRVELEGQHRSFLQSGSIAIKQSGSRTLTLASDDQLVGDRTVVLSLGCAAPD
ncbi:DUF2195 family protein [Bordetella petrii]|nr:DUF2195 family protein [Bordetella petrii]